MTAEPKMSQPTAERLSLYLRCLELDRSEGRERTSSGRIAETLGISDAQVRKDLIALGSLGRPGVGYTVAELMDAIRRKLGLDKSWKAVIVGVGNLARALMRYQGFRERGFDIVGLFDNDPTKIGEAVDGLEIHPVAELPKWAPKLGAELALLAVPAAGAQAVADLLAGAGIRGVLNFAPTVLRLPNGLRIVNVDLALQMEQLAFRLQTAPAITR